MQLSTVKNFSKILVQSFRELQKNDPLRLAGATAFFTTFALPPILIILIQLFALVFKIENLGDKFFQRFAEILGGESTAQIKATFMGFKSLAKNRYITVGGFIFLMFVATTLFKVIKDSVNQLWNIRIDTKAFRVTMEKRAASMLIILLAGILFMASTVIEGTEALLGEYLNEVSPGTGSLLNVAINKLISVVVVTAWFSVLFKVLPDARPTWKVVICGGFFTGILFTIGKMVIRFMLSTGNIHTVFGASTATVFLLLFVFYCSFIMYYGACFTKAYADHISEPIHPADHAVKYEVVEKRHIDEKGEEEIDKEVEVVEQGR